jgi:hypothetical protein
VTLPKFVVPGTLTLPSTTSTDAIYGTIRKRLIDYVSPSTDTLAGFVGTRIWVRSAPADPLFPYLTLRLDRTSLAEFNGYRETASLEIQAVGKPESQLPLVESAMDIVDQALTSYTAATSGLIVGRSRTRQTMPQMTDPADSAVVAVVATYELFFWPRVLTSRAV